MLPPTMEEVQSATDTRSGIDARLESQTEADGRHEEGSGPTSTQTGHNGGHAEKQQTQKPACPRQE